MLTDRERTAEAKLHRALDEIVKNLEIAHLSVQTLRGESQIGATVNFWTDEIIVFERVRQQIVDSIKRLP